MTDRICLLVIASVAVLGVFLYPQLPDMVVTGWNMDGEPVRLVGKFRGTVTFILMPLTVYLACRLLGGLSLPDSKSWERKKVIGRVTLFVTGGVAVCAMAGLLIAAGIGIELVRLVDFIVAVWLVLIGNYLGKCEKNFFLGIRTSLTLASDAVWFRIHRIAGWGFVTLGACQFLALLGGWGLPLRNLFFSVFLTVVVLMVCSLIFSRQKKPQ